MATTTSIDARVKTASGAELCSSELTWDPWAYDARPDRPVPPVYGAGASQWDAIPDSTPVQGEIPERYRLMAAPELARRIAEAKARLGSRLVILGHHYQRDEIIRWADFRGDSFKLSQQAAARADADYIVFCGVHFMAESADILARDHQRVILPNLAAGCSMADMADEAQVRACWSQLAPVLGLADPAAPLPGLDPARDACAPVPVIPVTYMNSSAALKAFCGERGGVVCTSSNAARVLEWAFARGERVLFFPDEHLGRNTGAKLGLTEGEMVRWDPRRQLGGQTAEAVRRARLILWRGWCSVHARFTVAQIEQARRDHPGLSVIVHPECRREVVEAADLDGSTEFILETIAAAPPRSQWAVGTEINMVNRLAVEHPDKRIFCLDPVICPCSTMYRIHPAYLAWVLEGLVDGQVFNEIVVDDRVKEAAGAALARMLALPGPAGRPERAAVAR
ncbi:MAG TPA: quinolinate synthase NadA [Candidatus Binatia bacterium]|nr:quinolinate synthase NadA [Candidatus Binatia bacterium]